MRSVSSRSNGSGGSVARGMSRQSVAQNKPAWRILRGPARRNTSASCFAFHRTLTSRGPMSRYRAQPAIAASQELQQVQHVRESDQAAGRLESVQELGDLGPHGEREPHFGQVGRMLDGLIIARPLQPAQPLPIVLGDGQVIRLRRAHGKASATAIRTPAGQRAECLQRHDLATVLCDHGQLIPRDFQRREQGGLGERRLDAKSQGDQQAIAPEALGIGDHRQPFAANQDAILGNRPHQRRQPERGGHLGPVSQFQQAATERGRGSRMFVAN